jgi:hypothetical protein
MLPEFSDNRHMNVTCCQPYTLAAFTPQRWTLVLIPVRVWVDPRVIVWPKGLSQWQEAGITLSVQGSNPGGGEASRTRLDRSWSPPSLVYNRYQVSRPGAKRPGRGDNRPHAPSAKVEERVELYLYSPLAFMACSILKCLRKSSAVWWPSH